MSKTTMQTIYFQQYQQQLAPESTPSALVALCERKCCWIVILIIAQGRKGNCVTIKNGNSVLWNYRSITLYCITTSNKSCFEV
jgi:predicted amidohydrolase